jgi:hypothetical protein
MRGSERRSPGVPPDSCRRRLNTVPVSTLQSYPAELKPQAEAFYKTDRAQRLLGLATREHDRWHVQPNPQLAFRFATVPQRLFTRTRLEADEYARRWSGENFSRAGAHHYDQIHPEGSSVVLAALPFP